MQTVPNSFHKKSQASIRRHNWSFLASFDKEFDDSKTFFILDSSDIDGHDSIAPVNDNPMQYWDYYDYSSQKDRVISLEWDRETNFPYSMQSSECSVVLNNFDNYYSSDTNSPISQYLIPSRPVKLLSGYHSSPLLQQFVGLTHDKPEIDQSSRTAKFEASDYLTELFKLRLSDSVAMSNVRTDEALAALFTQFGIAPHQYELAVGRNRIPFLFIARGTSASEVFRDVMQAEGGQLWIDEQGIIRFEQRLVTSFSPVFTFDETNISSMSTSGDTEIINRVEITSNIREVQDPQPIHAGSGQLFNYTLTEPVVVPAGGTGVYSIDIEDPLGGYSEPTLGELSDDSWFTARTFLGEQITSNISVTQSLLTFNTLSLTFTNTNTFDAYVDNIEIYGEPAKVVDTIEYEAFDQTSIDEYGEFPLEIENDMFGSESNCESFAYTTIDAYSDFDNVIELTVKGNPALQLSDIIWVDTKRIKGQFKILKTSSSISSGGVNETIRARRYKPKSWFILNESDLDGTDVLAP